MAADTTRSLAGRTGCIPALSLLAILIVPAPGLAGKTGVPEVRKILESTDAKLKGGGVSMPKIAAGQGDTSLAPYFQVRDGELLPLKETSARVRIAGVIASVEVEQVYANEGKDPIEALYVFPASTRAAVHGMRMQIGERTIVAKIEERQAAKETYEAAKSEGKKASLLEEERPNVFTMRVANIMPGDTIKVKLEYSELLTHEGGVYELVYPTVVGPRFGEGADPGKDAWISNPYLHEGEPEPYTFGIEILLDAGTPIQDLKSPSHAIDVKYTSPSSARIGLKKKGGGNRDFVLRYRLAGKQIGGQVLLYEHPDESFFVLMMQPPAKPKKSAVLPREYIFVLDVSGSMSGFPLATAKKLMKNLLKDLGKDDHFNIVTFAGTSAILSPTSLAVTKDNRQKALSWLESLHGGGGTELMSGLRSAYAITRPPDTKVSRSVVLVTDGYVGIEDRAFRFVREHLDEASLFAFGIGTSVNRYLIEALARAGQGEPFVVLDPSKASSEASRFRQYIERPVLTSIKVKYDGFDVYDESPTRVPDLLAERPLVILGKYRGTPTGHVKVTGTSAAGSYKQTIDITKDAVEDNHAPIRHLWARSWVALLEDQLTMLPGDDELEETLTSLGLHYSLLTRLTSFVAVDKIKTNKKGKIKTVKQPLPLPQGVSDKAVGQPSMTTHYKYNYSAPGFSAPPPVHGQLMALLGSATTAKKKPSKATKSEKKSSKAEKKALKSAVKEIKKIVRKSEDVKSTMSTLGCDKVIVLLHVNLDTSGRLESVKVEDVSKTCPDFSTLSAKIQKAVIDGLGTSFKDAAGQSFAVNIVIKK